MDKQIITFSANEQTLRKTGGLDIYASKTVSYIEAHFDLGQNWSGYDSVEAVWWNDYVRPVRTVLDTEGVCVVPTEVLLRKSVVYVNLVGVIASGNTLTDRLTTHPITALTNKFNAQLGEGTTTPLTPSEYEQFVATVKADADRAETAKDSARGYAESASASAESASASASGASASAVSASLSAQIAEDAKTIAQASANSASASAESASEDAERAENAKDAVLGMRAEATTLEPNESATASYSNGVLTLGIPKGDKGDRGQQGIQGDTGATPNFTIGTVETLEPTEDATATITGTAENPILNLGIPQGEVGEVSYADLKSLLPMDTASGAIVSIPDGQSVIPVDSLKVSLEPIQDLHGYDKPWSGGAGANIIDVDNPLTFTGIKSVTFAKPISAGTIYTYARSHTYATEPSSGSKVVAMRFNDANGQAVGIGYANSTAYTVSLTGDAVSVLFYANGYSYDASANVTVTVDGLMVSKSPITSYEPYSNICPISGHTECVTEVCGKNLIDPSKRQNLSGNIWIYKSDGILLKANTTYTLSVPTASAQNQIAEIGGDRLAVNYGKTSLTYTPEKDVYAWLDVYYANPYPLPSGKTTEDIECQLELGSTATTYEAFNGTTHTTALGRTVYGGVLDVISGELVVDRGSYTFTGNETISMPSSTPQSGKAFRAVLPSGHRYKNATGVGDAINVISSKYKSIAGRFGVSDMNIGEFKQYGDNQSLDFCSSATALDLFRDEVAGTTVVYELATPTTVQLTPTEVKLLLGNNTIWSDGDVAIVYSADVTKWIEKQLS